MKKAFVLGLFLIGIISINSAQNISKSKLCDANDARLTAKFNSVELNKMSSSEVCKHIHILDNGYFIADIPSEKLNDLQFDGEVAIQNLSEVNIYDLDTEIKEDRYQYFKITGTDKMIAIKPMFLITTERVKK